MMVYVATKWNRREEAAGNPHDPHHTASRRARTLITRSRSMPP